MFLADITINNARCENGVFVANINAQTFDSVNLRNNDSIALDSIEKPKKSKNAIILNDQTKHYLKEIKLQ